MLIMVLKFTMMLWNTRTKNWNNLNELVTVLTFLNFANLSLSSVCNPNKIIILQTNLKNFCSFVSAIVKNYSNV